MALLRIDLLGCLDVRLATGAGVTFPTKKSCLLLAYLALGGAARSRATG